MVCSFQLLDDGSEIEYIFETENHYVRFDWGTSG